MKHILFAVFFTAGIAGFYSCDTGKSGVPAQYKDLAEGIYAEVTTAKGVILLQLDYDKVPMTAASFIGLAEGKIKNTAKPEGQPYFDSLKFHRVEAGFVVQGGDPAGNGSGGPGYKFPDEPFTGGYLKGTLAMANAGANTNGSQFFIMLEDNPGLPKNYTIFGRVAQGQEVVNNLKAGDVMQTVKIYRLGDAAESFDAAKTFEDKKASFEKEKAEQEKADKEAFRKEMLAMFPDAKETASGLLYIMEKEGTGANPVPGQIVSVHYNGTLVDGTKFDSSYDRGEPIEFPLGQGMVIPGWEEGIALLKKGGKEKLIIPYRLAYGAQGRAPVIPPKATLLFDVELVDIKSE